MRKPSKFRLYVGKCDIEKAKQSNSMYCPIECALMRKFPKSVSTVGLDSATIGKDRYNLCNIAENFIDSYDSGENVNPVKIILNKSKHE